MKIYYIPPVKAKLIEGAFKEVGSHKRFNPHIQRGVTIATVCLINATTLLAEEVAEEKNPLKELGDGFIGIAQQIGLYVALAMCLFEVIKSLLEGDPKRVPGVIAKYAIGVLAIYTVPGLFGAIAKAFGH